MKSKLNIVHSTGATQTNTQPNSVAQKNSLNPASGGGVSTLSTKTNFNIALLIKNLKDFNSKERFFLIGEALGNTSFNLSASFIDKLSKVLNLTINPNLIKFVAMDYHLDWLYASLEIANRGNPDEIFNNNNNIIEANQEDIDLIVAFEQDQDIHLVLIEAKGVTPWTNEQLKSKATRLEKIFGKAGNYWLKVVPHFVIVSPKESKKLKTGKFPAWMMAPDWIELKTPPDLWAVTRCDVNGKSSKAGDHWKTIKR